MSSRYFVESPISSDLATLSGAEAHHLAHVMRASVGDTVMLFDGSGYEFSAVIQRIGKHGVELSISARVAVDREPPLAMHLGVALPKGDRQAWLVEKAVELGVSSLTPLRNERSVAQPVEKALVRLRRGVIEASKQCGRTRLMQIAEPATWPAFLRQPPDAALRCTAHPGGRPVSEFLDAMISARPPARSAYFAIGPEGGLTNAEVQQAIESGWQVVDLGPRILRVETAAICLAALAGSRGKGPESRV